MVFVFVRAFRLAALTRTGVPTLVNNAGYGQYGTLENVPINEGAGRSKSL
jgi:short-subunit dehydrogenase